MAKAWTCRDLGHEIEKKPNRWRLRANAYYWGVMLPTLAREMFCDVDWRTVHEHHELAHLRLKAQFLPCDDAEDAELVDLGRSVSVASLCDECFGDYMNRLTIMAGLNGIKFPTLERYGHEERDSAVPEFDTKPTE